MAANKIHDLKQTSAVFQVRGVVTGMKKEKKYQYGITKTGNQWNSVEFGVTFNENKTVFVKLQGFQRPEVFYYKRGEKGQKGTTARVAWKDRKNCPGEGFRLIGVNVTVGKDENNKNINEMLTEYDAAVHLAENLKDGQVVFIRGNMEFSSYVDKNGNTKRKIELVPTQVSYIDDSIDFSADSFKEMAEFENTLVYSGIEKETDENDKPTGRFILSGYSIGYSNIEPVNFIIDKEHAGVANAIRKKMEFANSIKTYGRISIVSNVEEVVVEDDGWGSTETSPMERQSAPVIREYVVYKVDGTTFDKETYTEAELSKALKAIKNAKEASSKFVDTSDEDSNDWGTDVEEDDTPWDD